MQWKKDLGIYESVVKRFLWVRQIVNFEYLFKTIKHDKKFERLKMVQITLVLIEYLGKYSVCVT